MSVPHEERRATVHVSLTVACLIVTLGCADVDEGAWKGSMTELPNGATLVSNLDQGTQDEHVRLSITDSLWIGSTFGDGPDVFGSISNIAVDSLGTIYVFDDQAQELRTFASSGELQSRFGRRGAGPGEFEAMVGMSEENPAALWLVDGANVRYTVLRSDGFQDYRRPSSLYNLPWLGGHAHGDLYDSVVLLGDDAGEVLVQIDPDGIPRDTMRIPTPDLDVPTTGTLRFPLPYAPKVVRAFDARGYVWIAVSHEYRLIQLDLGGDTVRVVTRNVEAPELTREQSIVVEGSVRALTGEFRVQVDADMIPSRAPLIEEISIADDGGIWVRRATDGDHTVLDVFDPEGRYVGDLELQFPLSEIVVEGGLLYGAARTELDVPMVFRGRVQTSES